MLGKLFRSRRRGTSLDQVGVVIDAEGVLALALRRSDGQRPQLLSVFAGNVAELAGWVAAHSLQGAPTALVLEHGSYGIHQLERPEVPAEELRDALRWKLKDLLDYSPAEAVIDFFETPPARQKRIEPVQVVAARRALLKTRLAELGGAGLELVRIDIPEFALRNLVSRALAASETTAVLYLQAQRGMLAICRDDRFYMARALDHGLRSLGQGGGGEDGGLSTWSDIDDRIALEVQRTMDYYDSHFGHAPVKRLLLPGTHPGLDRLAGYAATALGIAAERAGAAQLCSAADALDSDDERLPLAIGGALGID